MLSDHGGVALNLLVAKSIDLAVLGGWDWVILTQLLIDLLSVYLVYCDWVLAIACRILHRVNHQMVLFSRVDHTRIFTV